MKILKGYVVVACDHPGSARYTIIDGQVVTPSNTNYSQEKLINDRPLDILQIINGLELKSKSASTSSRNTLYNKIDTSNVAISGMSFGGYSVALTLEYLDPRIKAAVMMCSSIGWGGEPSYSHQRKNKATPVMVMVGTEDTVLGAHNNDANRQYYTTHTGSDDAFLVEIYRAGHCSFTSCELYDPNYGKLDTER